MTDLYSTFTYNDVPLEFLKPSHIFTLYEAFNHFCNIYLTPTINFIWRRYINRYC